MSQDSSLLKLLAPAKVNLSLWVLKRRPDGYHEIETLLQTVSLYDEITISEEKGGIKVLSEPDLGVPPEKNLAYLAAGEFFQALRIKGEVKIQIAKRIPPASGLGGGSSDAACALNALNKLYGNPLSFDQLLKIAEKISCDSPFFLYGGLALAKGRGEKISPLPLKLDFPLVLTRPERSLLSKDVYERVKIPESDQRKDPLYLFEILRKKDLQSLVQYWQNDLGEIAKKMVPEISLLEDHLIRAGALGTLVSGSGSALFGLFKEDALANETRDSLRRLGYWAEAVSPVTL